MADKAEVSVKNIQKDLGPSFQPMLAQSEAYTHLYTQTICSQIARKSVHCTEIFKEKYQKEKIYHYC